MSINGNGRFHIVDDPDLHAEAVEHAKWQVDDYCNLRGQADRPERGLDYIEGLVRAGEVLLIGSSSKAGKSWLVGNLIWAAISGKQWIGRDVRQGKVLLIDNELKRGEIDWRHSEICFHMQHQPQPGELKVFCRRGQPCDIQAIDLQISLLDWAWEQYSLIVIDAIYKTIPDGKSENDNEAMAKLMNVLQGIAEKTGVPVVGVHHSTKGSQGDKSPLDVFAGAGAFGRALDNAVVVRDHEDPELSVIDYVSRTHPPQEQQSAKFDWPIWTIVGTEPAVKRQTRQNANKQKVADETGIRQIVSTIPEDKPILQQKLLDLCELSRPRGTRLLAMAKERNLIIRRGRRKKGGKKKYVFWEKSK